jgi:hypothetical protein
MKQHPNSIYYTLRNLTNNDERKLAVSYVYSVLSSQSSMNFSRKVLVDEGQYIYNQLDRIGRVTLDRFQDDFIDEINVKLENNSYNPRKGGVEETVVKMINTYGIESTLEKVGVSLKKLLNEKPNLQRPIKQISAGNIQRYEQQAIKKELLKYIK